MNTLLEGTRREAEETQRTEHVQAETALSLLNSARAGGMHPFPGEAVLRAARHGSLEMVDAVVAWRSTTPAALCWTAPLLADESTEKLVLLELAPHSNDAITAAIGELVPAALRRGVTHFETTLPTDDGALGGALYEAGLTVQSQICLGGIRDVRLAINRR